MTLRLGTKFLILISTASLFGASAEVYTVQKGDTIEKIAKKYGISQEEIIKVNNIKNPKSLRENQKINIPEKFTKKKEKSKSNLKEELYEVKSGDNLEKIAKKYNLTVKEIMDYNDMRDEKIFAGDQLKIPLSQEAIKKKKIEQDRKTVDLSKCETYIIKRGGTLKHVSKKIGVDFKTLEKLNNLESSQWLEPGTKICIGEKKEEKVESPIENCELIFKPKSRVSVSSISKKFNISKDKIKQINSLKNDYVDKGQTICLETSEEKYIEDMNKDRYSYYRVKKGDTIESIAQKYGLSSSELKRINKIRGEKLKVGQKIKVPQTVKESKVAQEKVEEKPEQTARVNLPKEAKPKVEKEENYSPNSTKLAWPVNGNIVAGFQNDENVRHLGIEISTGCGEKVKAAESGKVVYAGDGIKAFGNLIVIRHDNGLTTVYGYLSNMTVSEGERVSKGGEIGKTGKLKNSENCGIYFEVRKNVTPLDPLKLLE